ncbi:helix-turn-helix transcriptional regulator [Gordonia terrae]|uniref:Helix-turn-helix transcriptional regulator n=1 Tax=Gordonia terrae TaxID=2055 RepID=A0A2I1R2W3_9ACTN|nr:LuxR C-terminal-related transcriptional regulator [Gordonia terrae]PKZ63465.1 helix-turn-helix transcriptional regulator [Gordonia terrae]
MRSSTTGRYHEALGSAADLNTRADELLSALGERVSSSASAISVWDPVAGRHLTLANHDYPDSVMRHFNSWFVSNDPLFKEMERTRSGALRWRDFPGYRRTHSVTNVFTPAGFDEGLSARLVTAQGTYAGTLHVNSEDRRYPRDVDVTEINELRSSVASLLDTTMRPVMVADFLSPGSPAWLIDRSGNCRALHDQPMPDVDPELLSLVARFAGTERKFRWCDTGGTWHLIRLLPATPRYRAAIPVALTFVTPEPLPFDLTGRELEVLTLVANGLTSAQIAGALLISAKTVGRHIEHLLGKTRVANRVGLATLAHQHGLLSGRQMQP